ncbi:hypothetical protein DSCO28_46760 [Desulfosarcina ovata subsp. sediminis]|uniref:Transglycosylase SLT domain-containing protein n=1 Tax=Desulfosarcina ovata subsp. sediminis TaxID=885957 RepID=A0A5K7ZV81_9BACT|nr:transglycosylase SLT domain-containing protein [Desulfosarcina ovata]BBO84110.1 hypothetical protein DSCO28_46760 [Desulfosarcina ovata subsp. sediminis]
MPLITPGLGSSSRRIKGCILEVGPAFDWRHFKAQAVAESRLQAAAKSRVGAVGLMQIMPRTFAEIRRKQPAIYPHLA